MPKFRFNVPQGYAIDLTEEPEEEGMVYTGAHGALEIVFAYIDDVSIEHSIQEFLDSLDTPYQMISKIEKISISGLEGLQCRYEIEGDYYYEADLALDIPEAYQPVNALTVILRAKSLQELGELEKDVNIRTLVRVY